MGEGWRVQIIGCTKRIMVVLFRKASEAHANSEIIHRILPMNLWL